MALAALALGVGLLVPAGMSAAATGAIEGEVVDAVSNDGIFEAYVCAVEVPDYEYEDCDETDANGHYVLDNVPDGSYVVEFFAGHLGYLRQYFDGKALFSEADEVVISGGTTVPNVDAKMDEGGKVEGTVTDAATSVGVEEVEVCAYSETAFGRCVLTDSSGVYKIIGLPTDSYLIEFWGLLVGYETRFYDEAISEEDADLVSVVAPDATPGIDARLGKTSPPRDSTGVFPAPAILAPPRKARRGHRCRKGFKSVKRHGRHRCVKRHGKKHRGHRH